ncbi:MAG TPA: YcgN family cysteine cluster protein [Alphaproteobacteria bacterium]|nr:YcgN family cysteine cluster protein [Alphaproteobacteria bacterium]
MTVTEPFWKAKTLAEMTSEEWESLCDGCGKCCLHKLEDWDTGEVSYTNVACRLLDLGSCQCGNYKERKRLVPDCLILTSAAVAEMDWLPETCAYRLVAAGKDLAWWHPLVSGNPETVHQAGISVRGRVISERRAGDLQDHLVDWT